MLRPVPAAASLVVCSTCRLSKETRADAPGRPGGEVFLHALHDALADHACRERVDLQAMLLIRSGNRLRYILGRFAPAPSAGFIWRLSA